MLPPRGAPDCAAVPGASCHYRHMTPRVLLLAAALLAAGCGIPPAPHHHADLRAATPPPLSFRQGARICADLNRWADRAASQPMPRFGVTMQADESEASGSQLGSDLATLDGDLQTENSAALLPGPPGYPTDESALKADCRVFGANFTDGGLGG